jgi:hypothetical protein
MTILDAGVDATQNLAKSYLHVSARRASYRGRPEEATYSLDKHYGNPTFFRSD